MANLTTRQQRILLILRSFDVVVDAHEITLALDRFVGHAISLALLNRDKGEDGNE